MAQGPKRQSHLGLTLHALLHILEEIPENEYKAMSLLEDGKELYEEVQFQSVSSSSQC